MMPTICPGETVVIETGRTVRRNDVILMKTGDALLIHRVMGRLTVDGREWYIHMGDNSFATGIVREDEVIGVVARRSRRPRPVGMAGLYMLLLTAGALIARIGFHAMLIPAEGAARRLFARPAPMEM